MLVEDEAILAKNMRLYLERMGYEVRSLASAEEALTQLDGFAPDVVVLDYKLPGMDGLKTLERLRQHHPNLPVIMITGHANVDMAVQAMKSGALDFLTKPVALSKLAVLIERATQDLRRESALTYYQERDKQGADLGTLIGRSSGMKQLQATMRQLLDAESRMQNADAPAVLLLGETGAGKEVVARALHFNGPRRHQPFVELNCAALPAPLLESELFGHERGAFTDARERKLGLVETAEGGTLFLDEIGDMELGLQAKVLKLLEERTVRRLGSVREQQVNVRIVAATHRPLDQLVSEGAFRADLYFRLRVVQLRLPPLRERGDDILLLAQHFIGQHAARYNRVPPTLSVAAQQALMSHPWPGNVRELRNALEQAVLLGVDPVIEAGALGLGRPSLGAPTDLALEESTSAGKLAAATAPLSPAQPTRSLIDMERDALRQALERTRWNVSRAARELGISRDTLRYRMDKHGLAADAPTGFGDSSFRPTDFGE